MEKYCNLELRLSPSTSFSSDQDSGDDHHRRQPRLHHFLDDESSKNNSQSQQQQMTIFYNGRICVGDFTEDRARAIMMIAARPMEEGPTSCGKTSERSSPEPSIGGAASGGLSMKRSLQRFLQKRKNRIQSAAPYHHQ